MRAVLIRLALAIAAVLVLAGCGAESSKRRLLDTGNKYFNSGKFKEASIIYRKAIQKDLKFGEAYYRLGLTELRLGRYGDAIRALRRASELQPENEDAHSKLGDLYLSIYLADRKKYKQLLVDFEELSERLLKRNPRSFEGLRMRGYLAVARDNIKEAVADFAAANEVQPGNPTLMLALVQAMAADGREAEAEKLAREFIASHKSYGPMYDFLYLAKVRLKRTEEAESILRSKAANNPSNPTFLLELAAHYLRNGERERMKAELDGMIANKKEFPQARQLAGDFYRRIGDLEAAYQHYKAGEAELADQRPTFQKKMVEILALQGRRQEAVQLAQSLVDENKDDAEAKALRASLRLQTASGQELDTAITEFQSVLARMPDNPVVRFNLGEAYMAKGDIDQARVQFQEAVKLRPGYLPPKLALSRIHLTRQEHARAIQLADEIIAQAPNMAGARLIRITALMGMLDTKTARTELDELLKNNPDLRDAHYLSAMLDFSQRRFDQAERQFRHLFQSNPPDVRGLMGLVEVFMATGRAEQARLILEAELKRNPASRNLKLALGNVFVRSENFDQAAAVFQGLLQETPDSADLHLRLGETFRRAQRWDDAIQSFEKACQLNPRDVTPFIQLANVLEITGKRSRVKETYEHILKLAPDNPVALNNLAYLLAEAGTDLDQALTYAQKAKQKMPNNPDIADTLGWVYIKKNLSDDAIKIFRDLLNQQPGHVTWRYHLGMALFQKGDKLEAKRQLEQALKNKPNKDEDQKIRDLLNRIG